MGQEAKAEALKDPGVKWQCALERHYWVQLDRLLLMVSSSLYVSHMFVTRVLSNLVFRVVLL